MSLRDYWDMVRRHALLVGALAAVVTTAAGGHAIFTRDYYLARTRLEITMERGDRLAGDPQDVNAFVSNDPAYFNTQLQLLRGADLLRRAVRVLDLEHNERFVRRMQKGGRFLRRAVRLFYIGADDAAVDANQVRVPSSDVAEFDETRRLAPYVADVQRRLQVQAVLESRTAFRETRLVDLVFEHSSPGLAATIANAIADAFVAESLEKNQKTGARANAYLTARIAELETEVRGAEGRLISYGRQAQILSLTPGQNVDVERLVNLNRQLVEAENGRKASEANFLEASRPDAARGLAADSARTVIGDTEVRLADLRSKRAQMLVGARETWPEVREITQQISALEADLQAIKARTVDATLNSLETKYRQALSHERALRGGFEQQRARIQAQNEAAVAYRLIQQEVESKKLLLAQALRRLGENDLTQAAIGSNVRVLDYALGDTSEPDGPWRLVYVGAALLLSLLVGIGAAIVLEMMDETFRSGADVEVSLGLPAVGLIRTVAATRRVRGRATALVPRRVGDHRVGRLVAGGWSVGFSEDYRRLRASVLLPFKGYAPRTLLITSSEPGEGKTTTAVNLAVSLAQSGAQVLLIDADLHHPHLHVVLGLDNSRGLSSALASAVSPTVPDASTERREPSDTGTPTIVERFHAAKQVLLHVPVTFATSGLYVLTAGPPQSNPAELLGSDGMAILLARFRSQFTHVIVDSPPVGPYSDGLILSTLMDGTLLVIRASKTARDSVRNAQQLLTRVGANVMGVVLNGVQDRDTGYYEYGDRLTAGVVPAYRSVEDAEVVNADA